MTTVLVVDDHPVVAKYTRNEILKLLPVATVLVAECLGEAEAMATRDVPPDYILLDLLLPDCEGLASLVRLRELAPRAVLAVVSGETDPNVMRDCFAQGARGYVTKNTGADEFTEALRKILENGFFYPAPALEPVPSRATQRLTQREIQVLRALSSGKQNKQLAGLLGISESTLKTYLRSIYSKLKARTRVQAVKRGAELGLVGTRRLN